MAEVQFSVEDVRQFIVDNGGKVTNHELVKHFKKYLSGSERQADSRAKFKDMVNAVATIKQEDGIKYLVLKKGLSGKRTSDTSSLSSASSETNGFHNFPNRRTTWSQEGSMEVSRNIVHSNSSPCIATDEVQLNVPFPSVPTSPSHSAGPWSPDLPPGDTPQPPPRRKNSSRGKENRGAKFEESMKALSEEKGQEESPRHEEIKEVVSPGNVKEKASKLNRMASKGDLTQKSGTGSTPQSGRRKEHRSEKNTEDDDCCSVSTLDPRRKDWMIKASQADYHGLMKLLREEPKLANCKDYNSYTALHWAAKHGNLDVIKLIAGTHKANANAKTSGGYTPLHLAAMFGREEIMEILINTYGADPSLRDYGGKRPIQYLPQVQAQRFMSLFPEIACNGRNSVKSEKDVGFHRIGSLNSKVKKTSVMFSGGKALTRMKSWGSADNIQERNLMPPPKFFPKRKKSRKQLEYFGASDGSKGRSGDSDSDSASTMTS